jgi:adenine-specific DNA-methyltransferase
MTGSSLDIKQLQLERLKEIFPEVLAEGKIDWEKLRITLGEELILQNERYVLNWAGKSDAFRAIQTPTIATLKPQKDQSINFDTTENIFIEGENLEVLKVLQKSYYGKIKMIYIDPPYNTGNDSFIYPDKFSESKDDYLKRIGDKDEAGYLTKEGFFRKNSKENGQYHSNWLSMMYPRLFLARNLLRDDGVIFVSIDDNEVHNLRLMMNEIYGEENFVASFVWKRRASSALAEKLVSTDHEYVICFQKHDFDSFRGKDKDYSSYHNPDNDERGDWTLGDLTVGMTKDQRPNQFYTLVDPETGKQYPPNPSRVWGYIRESMDKLIAENRVYFPEDINKRPMMKRFKSALKSDVNPISTWMIEVGMNAEATRIIQELFDSAIFSYSKPNSLVKELAKHVLENEDLALDFFAGSGTTAQAVLELNKEDGGNRKFILMQLPEKTDEESEAYKAGYKTIADICKERIRRVIAKLKEEEAEKVEKEMNANPLFSQTSHPELVSGSKDEMPKQVRHDIIDLGFKVYTLEPSNFKIWRTDVIDSEEDLKRQMNAFVDPTHKRSEAEDMAWEIILKSGYELTTKLEKIDAAGVPVFSIAGGELLLVLENIKQKAIDNIIAEKPKKVIALDRLFAGNDQLKTNTVLQMKDAGIEFKTI